MATSKTYPPRPGYRFLTTDQIAPSSHHDSAFELDESDIYDPPDVIRRAAGSRGSRKATAAAGKGKRGESEARAAAAAAAAASSLPVNVPDWSKILRGEYRGSSRRRDSLDEDSDGGDDGADGGGEGMRMPPHELLARTRVASFSVHEGRGRTLKGRDLSRVRNAIWEKTGFED